MSPRHFERRAATRSTPCLVIVKAFTIPNVPAAWVDTDVSLSDVVVQAGRDLYVYVRGMKEGERMAKGADCTMWLDDPHSVEFNFMPYLR